MVKLTPSHSPESVSVLFTFEVTDRWITEQTAATGKRPAKRYSLEVPLDEVPDQAVRRRLLSAERAYRAAARCAVLPAPVAEPEKLLEAIEAWLSTRFPGVSNEAFEDEMRRWAAARGSERLRMAIERGYKANALYARERAAAEFPRFWVHTGTSDLWKERTDPSLQGLRMAEVVESSLAGAPSDRLDVRVVWLVDAPRDLDEWLDRQGDVFLPAEAIVVRPYLGRYHLIQPLGLPRPEREAADDE